MLRWPRLAHRLPLSLVSRTSWAAREPRGSTSELCKSAASSRPNKLGSTRCAIVLPVHVIRLDDMHRRCFPLPGNPIILVECQTGTSDTET